MATELKTGINNGAKAGIALLLLVSDIITAAAGCALAYFLRFFTVLFGADKPNYLIDIKYIYYSIIFIIFFIAVSAGLRLYGWRHVYSGPLFFFKLIVPPIGAMILTFTAGKIYEGFSFSRLWLAMTIITSLLIMLGLRFLMGFAVRRIFISSGMPADDVSASISNNLNTLSKASRIYKKVFYGLILLISDIVFLGLAFYLSYFLRFKTGIMAEINETFIIEQNYIFYSILFIAAAVLIFFLYGLYDRDRIYKGSGYYSRLLKAVFFNIIVIIMFGYVFNLFSFSRKWVLLLFAFSFIFLYLSRFAIEFFTQRFSRRLDLIPRTIIVGIGENAKRIDDSLRKYSLEGDVIVGHVDKKQRVQKNDEYSAGPEVIGHLEDIKKIITDNNVQRVIISSPEFKYFEILEILESLKGMDITVLIFPGFFEFSLKRLSVREIGGVPLMQVSNIGFFGFNLFIKNCIDYALGIICFIIFIPIYLAVGAAIKLDSKGPVFFRQKRLTKDCREFYMYKFRSMYSDAEERLKDLMAYNEADGPIFKMKKDPRITRVGKFIRKFSIDELPQIINVLKGELSMVGPRPPLPAEVEKYDEWEAKRMNVKQGLTGLWQISGRSDLSFEEMARLDLYYIQNWSIEMDVKILLKTIPVMLFGKGAY